VELKLVKDLKLCQPAFYPKALTFNSGKAGLLACFISFCLPIRRRTVAKELNWSWKEAYSCGNSPGFKPDSLL